VAVAQVDEGPADAPTDEIKHASPDPDKVAAAREKASAAFEKAKRMEQQADIKTDPGEMPPASAGDNGTFDEAPKQTHHVTTADGLSPGRSALLIGRMAIPPTNAPYEVERAISAANAIVGTPYVWGGGHGSWNDNGYDCSGAVSYALGGAGLLGAPVDSSALMKWGEPGPGKWITVYANPGHTYAVIAGLRWDTAGEQSGTGPKWHAEKPYPPGYVVRHPPGL
jgi:cell wall-associated NlpC family hydrolase